MGAGAGSSTARQPGIGNSKGGGAGGHALEMQADEQEGGCARTAAFKVLAGATDGSDAYGILSSWPG